MSNLPRSKIIELVARYELEPDLKDMYVEGDSDVEILERCALNQWTIYSIDNVDITSTDLSRHNLTEGRKQRVIVLARELFTALQRNQPSHRCLVDQDLDHWFEELETTPGLIYTEHTSLELYFWSEDIIRDIVLIAGKAAIRNWTQFFTSFMSCLLDMYALRLADRELSLSATWPAIHRSLKRTNDTILLDITGYTNKILMASGATSQQQNFSISMQSWRTRLNDPCLAIRGHDFVELLAWTIDEFDGLKQFAHTAAISRLFVLLAPKVDGLMQLLY
jgi:hypothetical protein